jgi:membrane protease YdiL (CAAX protease family)
MSTLFSARLFPIAALILLGWGLSLFYGLLGRNLPPGWLSIALLHSVVAIVLWRFGARLHIPRRWGVRAYAPALIILGGSLGAAWLTRLLVDGAPAIDLEFDPRVLGFVLWIPIVEELVFRYGIGGWARQRLGIFWGAYASAVVFAMAHGNGEWNQLALPLGPLLLGLCCEWLYVASGRITAAMALHAACNASGWIFAAFDERWLNWLKALYLKI